MAECRAEIRVHGLVQGVFFRGSTRREARALGLRGWARNLADGTVEIVAEGDADAVEALVAWCRHGPPHARVTRVDVTRTAPLGDLRDFTID